MPGSPDIETLNINLQFGGKDRLLRYRVDPGQMSHRNIYNAIRNGRMYEASLSAFLSRVLRPGDTFLDIGAHIGFFTLLASFMVDDDGTVVAFEPNADNFAWLNDHIALNDRHNIRTVNAVACETDGTVDFYKNADNDGGHALWDPGLHDFNEQSRAAPEKDTYPAMRIDTAAKDFGLTGARAAKIDTEGAELTVLKGGEAFFTPESVPFVVCEMNSFGLEQMGSSERDLRAHMKGRGYTTFLFAENGGLPVMLPERTDVRSRYVYNVIFSTPEAVGSVWSAVTPPVD